MIDQQTLQAAVSNRIATEFGQTRLQLLEAQEIIAALQAENGTLQVKVDTLTSENAILHGNATQPAPEG